MKILLVFLLCVTSAVTINIKAWLTHVTSLGLLGLLEYGIISAAAAERGDHHEQLVRHCNHSQNYAT